MPKPTQQMLQKGRSIMTENIELFNSPEFGGLRTATVDGHALLCGKDVAIALGYSNPNKAVRDHTRGERIVLPFETDGGTQQIQFITEGDVLRLIVSSKLPKAQEYERWVFDEVLPAIHRDGAYVATDGTEDDMLLMARALKAADRSMKRKDAMIAELQPKALVADAVFAPSRTLYTVTEAARSIANIIPDVRREELLDLLKSTGMMCQRGTAPTRKGIDTGRMAAVCDEFTDRNGETRAGEQRGKLTPKGVAFCIERLSAGEVA